MNRSNNNKGKRKGSPFPGEDTYYESSVPYTTTIRVINMLPLLFQHNAPNMFQEYGGLNVDLNNSRGGIALIELENRHDADNDFNRHDITVGDDDEEETFKAHSTILKARSLYFNNIALSENWVKRCENAIILFEEKTISPNIFVAVLLTHFFDYAKIDELEKYLVNEKNEWFHQILNYVYKTSSRHQLFGEDPASILKSNYLAIIEKSMLRIHQYWKEMVLTLDEIDIWNYAILWGTGQNEKLHFRME